MKRLIRITLTILASVPLLAAGLGNYEMNNKNLLPIKQLINASISKSGIPEAQLTFSPINDESVIATISYKERKAEITFTSAEIENAKKGIFSSETKKKISESIMSLAPRIGPPFKPSN
ncbi:hypothetical protein [Aquicella siphonis]|nr:hypothetical protein [Aquicella siphonis]